MFRFGLRWVFGLTAAAAGLFAILFALPGAVGCLLLLLLTVLSVPVMIAGCVYSQGYGRAFAVGGLTWLAATIWIFDSSFNYESFTSQSLATLNLHPSQSWTSYPNYPTMGSYNPVVSVA
ncbi:MAG: hypothetical protein N2C14_29300, partial [Planctomycetales bacterium]